MVMSRCEVGKREREEPRRETEEQEEREINIYT